MATGTPPQIIAKQLEQRMWAETKELMSNEALFKIGRATSCLNIYDLIEIDKYKDVTEYNLTPIIIGIGG